MPVSKRDSGLPAILAGCVSGKIFPGEPNLCRVGRRQILHSGIGSRVNHDFHIYICVCVCAKNTQLFLITVCSIWWC